MIIKKFHGGSMASTFLIKENDTLLVRKEVSGNGKLNVDKLKKQYEWIVELEDEIRSKFPIIYNYDFREDYGQYTMEYLELNSFRDELLTQDKLSNENKIVIDEIIKICKEISSKSIEYSQGKQYILNKHFNKMFERCNMVNDTYFKSIMSSEYLVINGVKMKNLKQLLTELNEFIDILSPKCLNRSHGDYTFQNIMVGNNDIKIIDPRGEGYDPIYYDISKLLQSCHGKYDLMIPNNYECTFEDNNIEYKFYKGYEMFEEIYEYIINVIGSTFNLDTKWHLISKFYEGSHFISMVPFRYKESLENTILAYSIGIEILNDVLKELKGE